MAIIYFHKRIKVGFAEKITQSLQSQNRRKIKLSGAKKFESGARMQNCPNDLLLKGSHFLFQSTSQKKVEDNLIYCHKFRTF